MEEEQDLETKCKNCNHAMDLHMPRCSKVYYEFSRKHICGCERSQYYCTIISDTRISWTEFHCNECGRLIGFLNSINNNLLEDLLENKPLLCTNCIRIGVVQERKIGNIRSETIGNVNIDSSNVLNFYQQAFPT